MEHNIILDTDSYKFSHRVQYPPNTTRVFSFFESRGGEFSETVFFGLHYIVTRYLVGEVVTMDKILDASAVIESHLGSFDKKPWEHIVNAHQGRLPIEIKAVPEGTVVPTSNVLITVENTCDECFWLTNFLETMLVRVWYPSTVATQSREMKRDIIRFKELTGGNAKDVGFSLHDFGARGVSSLESSAIGGAAHLLNFEGTDNVAALMLLKDYYQCDMPGFSIPAAEHSTITAWGRERELDAFQNMLDQYPDGPVAVVSDSYDIFAACRAWTSDRFRDQIKARNGKLVVRPDSGDIIPTLLEVLSILHDGFGGYPNSKGYKTLHPNISVIQGDGITRESVPKILSALAEDKWCTDVLGFGSGGGLLQHLNRDTSKYAFKASAIKVDGDWRPVFKSPIGDPGKRSKQGRLTLRRNRSGMFHTTTLGSEVGDCAMVTVFRNGAGTRLGSSLSKIRELLAKNERW